MKLVVAISGASGSFYGIRLLEVLKELKIESHLIISSSGQMTIKVESDYKLSYVKSLADRYYNYADIGADISSGSFRTDGMIIAPCSMKSLAAIANGYEDNLISRAAGVILKERKPLTLMVRETPLSAIYLENMLKLARVGVNIAPPVPSFYNRPEKIEDIVNHSVARVLDLHGVNTKLIQRWSGISS